MKNNVSPNDWVAPSWHADFGNPMLELEPLRTFSCRLLRAEPNVILAIETPEPGLLYVRGQLPNGNVFEVYSVLSLEYIGSRLLAIFMIEGNFEEEEAYFNSANEATAFLVTQSPKGKV